MAEHVKCPGKFVLSRAFFVHRAGHSLSIELLNFAHLRKINDLRRPETGGVFVPDWRSTYPET
jgi:hypothetical protein